ncbi:MAG: response regulator transcription factor [Alistipes sp.]|nr:response regulator transcription factor [Alistipes sp.]
MKVLIVEDEIPAQLTLRRLIERCCPDSHIVEMLTSVKSTIKWLEENPEGADIIFMDVELSDGVCFDIFDKIDITANVIITTAYDNYAINAFKRDTRDYLLKPIDEKELSRAWERCRERIEAKSAPNIEVLLDMVRQKSLNDKTFKKRFIVKAGDKIVIIPVEEIAYCYSEDKSTYAVNRNGTHRLLDYSLDTVQEMLDPTLFFRISRSCIVSISAIDSISKHLGTRLKLQLNPRSEEDVIVSRSRTSEFLDWLDKN